MNIPLYIFHVGPTFILLIEYGNISEDSIIFLFMFSEIISSNMPTLPLSHDEFRERVCGVCWMNKKAGRRKITDVILKDIQEYHYGNYSLNNLSLPTSICNQCRMKLVKCRQVRCDLCSIQLYEKICYT